MAYMVTYSENMCTDFMQSLCPSAGLVLKCRLITKRMQLEVFLFAVRGRETALPDEEYIEKIAEAYGEHGLDFWFVEQAIDNAADSLKGGGGNGALYTGTT